MRILHLIIGVSLTAAPLVGCAEDVVLVPTVPTNVPALMAQQPGTALAKYGYTPVVSRRDRAGKPNGYVYCGHEVNLDRCSSRVHHEGTVQRPNIYVLPDGRIDELEGPHLHDDHRTYYVQVPTSWQHFDQLTATQQTQLLGIMPAVMKAIGTPQGGTGKSTIVAPPIGVTGAWAQ